MKMHTQVLWSCVSCSNSLNCRMIHSSLYTAKVMHHRLAPKKHSFWYRVYLFYLDLDEIEALSKRYFWFGLNRFNLFSFRFSDHLEILEKTNPAGAPAAPVKEQLRAYLLQNDVVLGNGKVMLLTNLAVLGYNFNPVSFYFCFDEKGVPLCAVAEISNTFREMKLFFIGREDLEAGCFRQRAQKYFYVSPFIDMDTYFDFKLQVPEETLNIKIDDYDQQGTRFFISTLTGDQRVFNTRNALRYFFSIPLIPLRVMWLIHWQAFLLWRKKIVFHKKGSNQHLQKNVYNRYHNN